MRLISAVAFLISILLSLPISMALIACDTCETGNCNCHISDCKSGILDVFSTIDCSSTPSYEFVFSNGETAWSPAEAYTYYLTAFCDDGTTKSECSIVTVKQGAITSTPTSTETITETTATATTTTTTTTTIPIYGPSEESAFGVGIRLVAIIAVIVSISVWAYSRL